MERRKFIKSAGLVTAAAYVGPKVFGRDQVSGVSSETEGSRAPEFPPLPFAYDALEPYIDARTMEIHYDKHFRAYYNNFINAIKDTPLEEMSINNIFANLV